MKLSRREKQWMKRVTEEERKYIQQREAGEKRVQYSKYGNPNSGYRKR